TTPPCPERLSMMMVCLRISDMRCPTTRAMMSFGPPGGKGTISRIVLFGKSCAPASAGQSKANPISNGLKRFTVILPDFLYVPGGFVTLLYCELTSLPRAGASRGAHMRAEP